MNICLQDRHPDERVDQHDGAGWHQYHAYSSCSSLVGAQARKGSSTKEILKKGNRSEHLKTFQFNPSHM